MKYRHLASAVALIGLVFLGSSFVQAQTRTTAEREAEMQARQDARDREITSRQIQRTKEIDLRLEERYYADIVRQVDAYSLDIYAAMLPMVRRMAQVELRARNLIYDRMASLAIALEPVPGQPLPDGIAAFDVEDKFANVQNCLDGRHYLDTNRPLVQTSGPCLLYDVPPSGVALDPSGLSIIPGPGLLNFNNSWPDFANRLSFLGGAPIFNIGGITLPPAWSPVLLPPFLPDGVSFTPPLFPDNDPFTRDNVRRGSIVPYYSPNSPQILTGFASQCLTDVPARYFPEYYPPAANMRPEEIPLIALDQTIDTSCPVNTVLTQRITDILRDLLNDLLGGGFGNYNPAPFPNYEDLADNLAFFNSIGILDGTPMQGFQAIDYCAPLDCTFPDEMPFNYVIDVERRVFQGYLRDMRNGVEIVRQAYRALTFDISQALAYHEYYLRNSQ